MLQHEFIYQGLVGTITLHNGWAVEVSAVESLSFFILDPAGFFPLPMTAVRWPVDLSMELL
jgi:hypothetical protein